MLLLSTVLLALELLTPEPDLDYVVADVYDTVEVLGNVNKPVTRHIREAQYTTPIEDDQYPWPGHEIDLINGPLQKDRLMEEAEKIVNTFAQRQDMTQEELYRHPAAERQFNCDPTSIDNAQRVKVRCVIDTRLAAWHFSGVYIPPGELITIELSEGAVGKVLWKISPQATGVSPDHMNGATLSRLPRLEVSSQAPFNARVNHIGWPFGGGLFFDVELDSCKGAVEINVSGVIMSPWFRYGVDSNADWEKQKKNPGCLAVLETGNVRALIASKFVRDYSNMTDVMRFWRTAAEMMDRTIPMCSGSYRPTGRPARANYWFIDSYVPTGEAVAFVCAAFSIFPSYWSVQATDMQAALTRSWGTIHEMGHHHQGGWGVGYTGEVSNNVFGTMMWVLYSPLSGGRYESSNENGPCANYRNPYTGNAADSWAWTVHPYSVMCAGTDNLAQYILWVHAFGVEKMREFMEADENDLYFPKKDYGHEVTNADGSKYMSNNESYLLRASKIFGYDMRNHAQMFGWVFSDLNPIMATTLDNMALPMWYPVSNLYMTGYEVDGKVIETALPFEIQIGETHTFDFVKYTKSRPNGGTFEFVGLTGRDGAWKEKSKGVYEYTTLNDIKAIDEYKVTYRETTSDQTTVCIGKIKLTPRTGNIWVRYNKVREEGRQLTALEAYRATTGRTADYTAHGTAIRIPTENSDLTPEIGSYVAACGGRLIVPNTGKYSFYAYVDDGGLFYLSEEPLKGNDDDDAASRVLDDYEDGYHSYRKEGVHADIQLTAGKIYYFRFVIFNNGGEGGGSIGYLFNDDSGWIQDVPDMWTLTDDSPLKPSDDIFRPSNWEEIRGINVFHRGKFVTLDRTDWSVTDCPPPTDSCYKLIDGDKSSGYNSAWHIDAGVRELPHDIVIDFGGKVHGFENFVLVNASSRDYSRKGYSMKSNIELFCDNSSVDSEQATWQSVYTGLYDSFAQNTDTFGDYDIKLSETVTCKGVKLTIKDNEYWWWEEANAKGKTAFSEIVFGSWVKVDKVVPMTNSLLRFSSGWKNVTSGLYYNGMGKYGTAGMQMHYRLAKGNEEFVIVGDRFTGEGNDASVFVDGVKVGVFSATPTADSTDELKYVSKAYRSILFVHKGLDATVEHDVRIHVEHGSIGVAGILANGLVEPPEEPAAPPSGSGSNVGAIVGGVVAAVVVIVAVILVVVFVVIPRRNRKGVSDGTGSAVP